MSSILIIQTLLAFLAVRAVPLPPSLNTDTLLSNGLDAQILNGLYAKVSASDACISGETACIGGNTLANCVNEKWQTEACPASLSCFAVPELEKDGTVTLCTTEKAATSLIAATGATGGTSVNVDGLLNSTASALAGDDCTDEPTPTKSSGSDKSTKSANAAKATVTVFVPANASSTITLTPVTTTMSPQEASAVMASLTQAGGTVMTMSAPSVVNGGVKNGGDSEAAPTTILLTTKQAQASAAAAAVTSKGVDNAAAAAPTTIVLTTGKASSVAAAAAAATPASSAAAGGGSGGYGYGGY